MYGYHAYHTDRFISNEEFNRTFKFIAACQLV